MNPLAVYNALYHDQRINGTTMIIDMGAENTDLIIADGETIWLRSIPIGGNNFTDVLVKSFKLPFNKAEDLKRNANTSKYARQIFQAMRPVFADLVAEIQRSIGFYSSVHRDSRIKKVLALGGAFRLAGLQKYLQQNLQLDVEKLNEVAAGAPTDAKLATTFNQNLLSLVSAYGLAIQAMNEGKITSNLLPMKIRREKLWHDKMKWFGAAAAIFLCGTGVAVAGYYMHDLGYKAAADIRDNRIAPVLSTATNLSSQWDALVGGGAADRLTIQNIRSMLDDRGMWINILDTAFGAIPAPPEGYPDPAYLKANPRSTREMIELDNVSSVYYPDFAALLQGTVAPELGLTPPPSSSTPGAPPATNTIIPTGSHGFLLTLSVTTPHENGFQYVLDTLVPKLAGFDQAAMTKWNTDHPADERNFYIAKVSTPMQRMQIKDDSARVSALEASYGDLQALEGNKDKSSPMPMPVYTPQPFFHNGYRPQYGGRPFGGRNPYQQPFSPPPQPQADNGNASGTNEDFYIDRLTGEDRRNDWEMQVEMVVIIDPPPAETAAPGAPAGPVAAGPGAP
jgi:hypothetical protein